MITIAGRTVKLADMLYHTGFQTWGKVTRIDSGAIELVIEGKSHGNMRKLIVTQGGNVNGKRVVFWHEPIVLDMPKADVSKIQFMVDLLQTKYGKAL